LPCRTLEQAAVPLPQPPLRLLHEDPLDLEEDLGRDPVALARGQERRDVQLHRRELGEREAVVDDRSDERGVLHRRRLSTLPRSPALLVVSPVDRLKQREERVLGPTEGRGSRLELTQVFGGVTAVSQPEQVEQPLAAVGAPHRAQHTKEGRLVLRLVLYGVATPRRARGTDLPEQGLQEAAKQGLEPGMEVDEKGLPAPPA